MRFVDLSIPKCAYWLEKLNVLFLVDHDKHMVPFINSSIATSEERQLQNPYSINLLLNKIYPEDLQDFERLLKGFNGFDGDRELRLVKEDKSTVWFRINSIRIGSGKKRNLLVALPLGD